MSTQPPGGTDNVVRGAVQDIAYLGDLSIYLVKLPTGKVVRVTQPNTSRHAEAITLGTAGLPVLGRLEPGRGHALDPMRRTLLTRCGVTGRGLVVVLPYVWLLLFFVVPFLIVLKISFSDIDLAIPPYKPLVTWDGKNALDHHAELQQLRVPVHRPAVHQGVPELDQGRVLLVAAVPADRLSDGLRHCPLARPRCATSC